MLKAASENINLNKQIKYYDMNMEIGPIIKKVKICGFALLGFKSLKF